MQKQTSLQLSEASLTTAATAPKSDRSLISHADSFGLISAVSEESHFKTLIIPLWN